MTEPVWHANVLYRGDQVLGWVGYDISILLWYARTAGTAETLPVRGTFDNPDAARDFLQFITSVENTND